MAEPKPKPVPRGTIESVARWAAAATEHPPCVICGRPVRKARSGEILCRYIERATCSKPCQRIHHREGSGRRSGIGQQTIYRKGELQAVDYAGGFGRQTVRLKPMSGRLPEHVEARSFTSVASGWLL